VDDEFDPCFASVTILRMSDPFRRSVKSDDRPTWLNHLVKYRGRFSRTATQIEETLTRFDPTPSGLSA
jgi:hypothetical protein